MSKYLSIPFLYFYLITLCFAHQEKEEANRWIHITGVGKVSAPPDTAILRLGVLTTAKTARLSTELNNQSVSKIFQVLDEIGLEKDKVETDRFQLTPQSQYRKGMPPLITGYQVNNSIIIRIHELDRVGEIMQATIDAGGNQFESLTYAVEEDQEFVEEARVQAMEDALSKAETLAGTLNAKVGMPLTIQELSNGYRPMQERRMMQSDAMMASVPVQGPAELVTLVQVQVKFILE